jgi:hypothetical protein
VVAAAAFKMVAVTAEVRTTAMAAMALVMITLIALAVAPFITRIFLANAIACIDAIAIAFISLQ